MLPIKLPLLTVLDLLGLAATTAGGGLPSGWESRAVRGASTPVAQVVVGAATHSLRLTSNGEAGWFYRKIEPGLRGGTLRWEWRTIEAPHDASFTNSTKDDSPIRVYVVFGKPGLMRSGRAIFYSFLGTDSAGYEAPSHASGKIMIVGLDGPAALNTWRSHEVDPAADYRRLFGREPDAITMVGIMQDTDQTGQRAVAEIRTLEWVSEGENQERQDGGASPWF